jgi:hypothetical protein
MIPGLIEIKDAPWKILPGGIHQATLSEVEVFFGTNPHRRALFVGLFHALIALKSAGCKTVYLDGSYVTGKSKPNDYDACWEPDGIDPIKLDPVFLDFDNKRANQKAKFGGEFFPTGFQGVPGVPILEFFQKERHTGEDKGILLIDLTSDPLLERES